MFIIVCQGPLKNKNITLLNLLASAAVLSTVTDRISAASYKLVLVEWEDSHGVSANWEYLSNCNPYVLVCKSVGWLIDS